MTEKHRQLIEQKLEKFREARILATDASVQFKLDHDIAELEAQLANNDSAKSPQTSTNQSRKTIKNSKNIINDSAIRAGRDVHIGDKITNVLPRKEAQTTNSPSNWKKWLLIVVATIAFLASMAEWTGNPLRDLMVGEAIKTTSSLTIKIRDKNDHTPLTNQGKVRIEYDNKTERLQPNEQGNINLRGTYTLGEILSLRLKTKGYQAVYPDSSYTITKDAITYIIETSCDACRIFGTVQKTKGNNTVYVPNVIVKIEELNLRDTTNTDGEFNIQIPPAMELEEYTISTIINKEKVKSQFVTPAPNVPTEILID